MRKVMIASHGKFASGIANSLELFLGKDNDIVTIDAYVEGENENYIKNIDLFLNSVGAGDQGIIFTDILGGSVNQKVVTAVRGRKNIFVITNMNLPAIISVLVAGEILSAEVIANLIKDVNVELVNFEEKFENISEDDFL